MPALGKLWAGRIFGTNTGNFFLEIDCSPDGQVTGVFRVMDSAFGLAIYDTAGNFDGTTLTIDGTPGQAQGNTGIALGPIRASGSLTPQGQIRGKWQSAIGTAGTFEAYPHDQSAPDPAVLQGTAPEQFYTAQITVGAVRIYADDIGELVEYVKRDFAVGRPIITYGIRGNEVTKYFEDFQQDMVTLGELRRFKLVIQEPEAHGINKVVVLELNAIGQNEIRVQGINESWVTGKTEAIARHLRRFQNPLLTTYKKFGLTLNQVIFLAMLVSIPGIHLLWQRAVFVAAVILMLIFLLWVHRRFIPNAVLYLSKKEPSLIERTWPTILSWLLGIVGSLIAAWMFRWFTR